MAEPQLEIVFRGDIAFGENLADVKERLRDLFKADDEQLQRLFSGRPIVIRRGLDNAAAERYQQALNKAGAVVEVRPASAAGDKQPLAEQPPVAEPAPVVASPDDQVLQGDQSEQESEPGWGIAPVGADLLSSEEKTALVDADINTSHLTLSPEGSDVLAPEERNAVDDRDVDTSHIQLGSLD